MWGRGCAGAVSRSGQWSEKSNAFDAGKREMGKVREKGLRRGLWPQWTVDSEQWTEKSNAFGVSSTTRE